MKRVYLDNAATTPLRKEVSDVMMAVLTNSYGNPSSSHAFGRSAKAILESCRKQVASFFNISPAEIIFTSGGTEANNLILQSAIKNLGVKHLITSRVEHHAVLHTVEALAISEGIKVSYVDLINGAVNLEHLEALLQTKERTLVSLMHVNNETGTILNIDRVGVMCKEYGAWFHSDTVQSIGHFNLDLQKLPIDFITASAHKFHGPKGIGFVFVRKNSGVQPILFGGEQERGLRPGTEALHDIAGMAEALKLAIDAMNKEYQYIQGLKTYFVKSLKKAIPEVVFNANSDTVGKTTATILNVRFPKLKSKGEMLQFQLDLKGIAVSRGSACQSGSAQVSHVLKEILTADELQQPSLRFSFSIFNTKDDVDYTIDVLKALAS
ncbi:MAG: cysteine desulfurase [Mangrovimonas sp.]|nr:cysteine desulfurase [Mangrovimonas sp.]